MGRIGAIYGLMSWFKKEEKKEAITAPAWVPERAMFELLTAFLDYGIIIYDNDFKILLFNKAAEEIFDVKAGDLVNQRFSLEKTKDPEYKTLAPIIYSSLAPTVVRLSEASVSPQVLRIILEEQQREFETYTSQINDDKGQSWGFLKLVKDKTREAALIKSKSEFITVAAHQLRTPASAVNWSFEGLEKDQTLNPSSKELLKVGHLAAKNLSKIINDLLDVAQLEEGKFGFKFQDLNLVDFLDKLLSEAMPIASQYKVSVYFEKPAEKEIIISADPNRLSLAISNLIDNAIKYNVPQGEVIISLKRLDKFIQVGIRDTGVGIPEEEMSKLFTKFFRAKNVTKFSTEGSGLGLYLVQNIINEHGGKVWAESILNRGSTFYFTLPVKS